MSEPSRVLFGIFVGGASRRMGQPKGLLRAPGSAVTLVERLVREVAVLGEVAVLVGERDEYAGLGLSTVRDARGEAGPLGGLVGLLRAAEERGLDGAVSVGCDFPYVTAELLRRLQEEAPAERIVAPHLDGRYQPLVARYSVSVLPRFSEALEAGEFALQPLLREFAAFRLPLTAGEEKLLVDWDSPEDVRS